LKAAPAQPPSDLPAYDINKFRNPGNAIFDSANCPKGNDASMVPLTDE
jgi:cholesterol transport system auxiliary component